MYRVVVCAFCISIVSFSALGQNYEAPLTEFGLPDLRGVWNFSTYAPFQRPESFGEREFLTEEELLELYQRREAPLAEIEERETEAAQRGLESDSNSVASVNYFWMERVSLSANSRTSVIVYPLDGRIPPVQDGVPVQRGDQNGIREIPGERPVRYTHGGIARNGPEDRGLSERCMVFNSGPPLFSGPYNNNIQIFQNRDHVVILAEMGFDARIVPLQKTEHVDGRITQWSGDSRGFFEGSILVVETRNFTDQVGSLSLRDVAYGNASNRLLVERFIPTGPGLMTYEWTIEDNDTFTDRIVGVNPMTKTDSNLYEYACHAGNYAIGNILKGARAEEGEI